MSRNTNVLFLVITGAIVILTIFSFINAKFDVIGDIVTVFQGNVSNSDNNTTPDAPMFKKVEIVGDDYLVYFNTAKNASRYKCAYGPRKTAVKNSALVTFDGDNVICKIENNSNNYYVQIIAINNQKETPSEIRYIENN